MHPERCSLLQHPGCIFYKTLSSLFFLCNPLLFQTLFDEVLQKRIAVGADFNLEIDVVDVVSVSVEFFGVSFVGLKCFDLFLGLTRQRDSIKCNGIASFTRFISVIYCFL